MQCAPASELLARSRGFSSSKCPLLYVMESRDPFFCQNARDGASSDFFGNLSRILKEIASNLPRSQNIGPFCPRWPLWPKNWPRVDDGSRRWQLFARETLHCFVSRETLHCFCFMRNLALLRCVKRPCWSKSCGWGSTRRRAQWLGKIRCDRVSLSNLKKVAFSTDLWRAGQTVANLYELIYRECCLSRILGLKPTVDWFVLQTTHDCVLFSHFDNPC